MNGFDRTAAPTVIVDAPDGSVALWEPPAGYDHWRALVYRGDATASGVEVVWRRPRGAPAIYACATCGSSHRYDHCPHARAATRAAGIYTKEMHP